MGGRDSRSTMWRIVSSRSQLVELVYRSVYINHLSRNERNSTVHHHTEAPLGDSGVQRTWSQHVVSFLPLSHLTSPDPKRRRKVIHLFRLPRRGGRGERVGYMYYHQYTQLR